MQSMPWKISNTEYLYAVLSVLIKGTGILGCSRMGIIGRAFLQVGFEKNLTNSNLICEEDYLWALHSCQKFSSPVFKVEPADSNSYRRISRRFLRILNGCPRTEEPSSQHRSACRLRKQLLGSELPQEEIAKSNENKSYLHRTS